MNIEDIKCTGLELAKELKANGYPQKEGLWWWIIFYNNSSTTPLKEFEELILGEQYFQDEWEEKEYLKIIERFVAPTEYWVNIPNMKGLYQISNFGQVRRIGTPNWKGKIIKSNITPNGYYYLDISVGNKRKTIQPHRIMAEVFLPNPNNYPQVNHKNGNKLANWIENLEWCTAKQNTQHACKMGLRGKQYGSYNPASKLTEAEVIKIKELLLDGYTRKKLAKQFNVKYQTIADIDRGTKWKHLKKEGKL